MKRKYKNYNNGIINKRIYEGDPIPEGFIPGMKPFSEEVRKSSSERRKKTNLERYGVDNPAKSSTVQEKMKSTNLERYGVGNPFQSDEIKEKIKDRNRELYGVEYPMQSCEIQEKFRQTSLERYGTDTPLQAKSVKDKIEKTNLERYGEVRASKSEVVKERVIQTNIEKYGKEYYSQTEEAKERLKETCLQKYGVENISQSDFIREKKRNSCMGKYGVKNPSQSEEVKVRKRQSCLEHYGTEYPLQSDVLMCKLKFTNQERYGTDYVFQSELCKEKSRKTSLEKYGTEYPTQSCIVRKKTENTNIERYGYRSPAENSDVKKKAVETSLEHWGTEYPTQSEEVKSKIRETNLEKYGVEYPLQLDIVRNKVKNTMIERYGVENPSNSVELREKVKQTNLKRHGVYWFCQHHKCRAGSSNDSSVNREFAELLDYNNISYGREFPIKRYSYDFKVNNTLIEIDPFPYHNSLWGPFKVPKQEDYHQKKSKVGEEAGFRVIHIFDWDDKSKIIDLLKPRERLYARNLTVFGIDNQECREYLNQYHLQGTCNGQSIKLGLRDKFGNLVSIMTFGKPRYNKNYQYELLRYCTTANVIGGAEKLFKHFIEQYKPESIISYCDKSKFRGDVYTKLGFKLLSDSRPSKHWYSPNSSERMQHITDNFLRQRGYDQIFNESYGKGTSNEELIIARGYVPIYDCGQSTYIWSSK